MNDAILLLRSDYTGPAAGHLQGPLPSPLYGVAMSVHLNTSQSQECCKPQDTLKVGSHPLLGDSVGDPKVGPGP